MVERFPYLLRLSVEHGRNIAIFVGKGSYLIQHTSARSCRSTVLRLHGVSGEHYPHLPMIIYGPRSISYVHGIMDGEVVKEVDLEHETFRMK